MERRRHKRARCRGEASCRLANGRVDSGEYENISEGGILLLLSADVKRDDILDIEFRLAPSEDPIQARGRVVHVRKTESAGKTPTIAGVSFIGLSDESRTRIGRKIWEELLTECTRFVRET